MMEGILVALSFFIPLMILRWMLAKWPPKTLDELIEEDRLKKSAQKGRTR